MLCHDSVWGQSDGKKNTLKVNATNPLIFGGEALIVGYEMVIGKNQSFSINIGRMSLPALIKGNGSDSIKLQSNTGEKGFHISADYRFYLAKENKYEAPRGVYIGPYYSYNQFSRKNEWQLKTSSFNGNLNTGLALNIHTVGVELGYQFILWKRLALDLVLVGPGIGFYQVKASINTTLTADQEQELFERLNEFLEDKIPGYNIVINEGEFKERALPTPPQ